ncbi:MAG: extracellular solute-binding protein [Lachnospiraceae bacterium]|nr:extracellular solute-binding protein [Lachnospiraceae bacterium]
MGVKWYEGKKGETDSGVVYDRCDVYGIIRRLLRKKWGEWTAPDRGIQITGRYGGQDSQEELYMIDVIPAGVNQDSTLDTTVGKEIADRFGIGFNFIKYTGDMQEKQAAMLASGDYNELQCMQTTAISDQYIQAGVLLNLIENFIPDVIGYYGISVRTDVLEYYGWPNLVTASDWIEFLKKAVKDFPEAYDGTPTVGLTLPGAEAYGMNLMGGLWEEGATYPGNAGGVNWLYNLETEEFEDAMHSSEKKESLKFFHDCYEAGVLDPELFTDNHDMTVEKMSNGSAIAVWYVNWNNKTANQALTEAGHPEMSYITQPIQLDSQKGQKFVTTRMFLYPFNQYGVTDKCKDPEKLLKFLNWCCTEEGQLLLQNGLEGVHYEIQDGERVPTDLYLEMLRDVELQNKEGLPGGLATGSYEMFQCLSYDMSVAEDFEKAYGEMLAEYEMLDYQSVIDARNEMLGEIMEQLAAGNE